jgi:hypothetical protein
MEIFCITDVCTYMVGIRFSYYVNFVSVCSVVDSSGQGCMFEVMTCLLFYLDVSGNFLIFII